MVALGFEVEVVDLVMLLLGVVLVFEDEGCLSAMKFLTILSRYGENHGE